MNKDKSNKNRKSLVHAKQMRLLELSCDSSLSLSNRINILNLLHPKYLIKAINETLEIKHFGSDTNLLCTKLQLSSKMWNTRQAMEFLLGCECV